MNNNEYVSAIRGGDGFNLYHVLVTIVLTLLFVFASYQLYSYYGGSSDSSSDNDMYEESFDDSGQVNPSSTGAVNDTVGCMRNRAQLLQKGVDKSKLPSCLRTLNPEADLLSDVAASANNEPQYDFDAYVHGKMVTPTEDAAHQNYLSKSRPINGTILAQTQSIFEPPPQKYYGPYRHPNLTSSYNFRNPMQENSVDDSERYTSWSFENQA